MTILHLEWAKRLKASGSALRRDGLSKRAAEIMVELVTKTGSYKEAMIAAGRLKAICAAAKYDDYWTEQVEKGFHQEMHRLEAAARALGNNLPASGKEFPESAAVTSNNCNSTAPKGGV